MTTTTVSQEAQEVGLIDVRDADHALLLMDKVDSLVRFCSVNMLDVDRYVRGSWAFWSVCHWIARHRQQAERDTLARMEPVAFTALVGTRRERRRIESVNELMRLINGGSFISEIRPVAALPPAPEAGQ